MVFLLAKNPRSLQLIFNRRFIFYQDDPKSSPKTAPRPLGAAASTTIEAIRGGPWQ